MVVASKQLLNELLEKMTHCDIHKAKCWLTFVALDTTGVIVGAKVVVNGAV